MKRSEKLRWPERFPVSTGLRGKGRAATTGRRRWGADLRSRLVEATFGDQVQHDEATGRPRHEEIAIREH